MYFWAEKIVAQNKNHAKEVIKQQKHGSVGEGTSSGERRHSLRPSAEAAENAALARDRAAALAAEGPNSGSAILLNILRALLTRGIFVVHSLATIWAAVSVHNDNSIWTFALVSVSIVVEGSYTIVMRAGDERKWFSPSVLLYILATAPPIWLLETKMCQWRTTKNAELENRLQYQILEQLLLVVLIVGRWLLPKGDISREQLSQILLAYLAISSDIVEFFDVFKERIVYQNINLQYMVLSAWTLSLFQFPFILTVSRARKMRVAITKEETPSKEWRSDISQVIYDIDVWALIVANSLQDIPFLLVRMYLIIQYKLVTYTMIFFLCKNVLIIVLQTYRGFVIVNDRYIHPKPPSTAELLLLEQRQQQRRSSAHFENSPKRTEKRRQTLAERRPTGISKPRRSLQSTLEDEIDIQKVPSARRASAAPRATKHISTKISESKSPATSHPPRPSFDEFID